MNPFDVLTTRLYNQEYKNGKGVLYTSWLDCFQKVAKTEGLYGFFKGTVTHYARIAPQTTCLLVFMEQLRKVADYLEIY